MSLVWLRDRGSLYSFTRNEKETNYRLKVEQKYRRKTNELRCKLNEFIEVDRSNRLNKNAFDFDGEQTTRGSDRLSPFAFNSPLPFHA